MMRSMSYIYTFNESVQNFWEMGSTCKVINKLTIALHKTTSLQSGKLSTMLQPQHGLDIDSRWCLDTHHRGQLYNYYIQY